MRSPKFTITELITPCSQFDVVNTDVHEQDTQSQVIYPFTITSQNIVKYHSIFLLGSSNIMLNNKTQLLKMLPQR